MPPGNLAGDAGVPSKEIPVDRPRVAIHNLTSLDGRLGGFPADVGLYYELAGRLPHQAVLTGSNTMLAAAATQGVHMSDEDAGPPPDPQAQETPAGPDTRPLLVLVDGRGRVTRYAWLRQQPFWRDVLVLCSAAAPASHLDRLRRLGVEYAVLGEDRVDLAAALRLLAGRYGVMAVRVDAGGGLNAALLEGGLADEISVVIAPYLAASPGGSQRLVAGADDAAALALDLTATERLRNGHIWLRYAVRGISGSGSA
jgi:2,5-diamino-6-(ribosylamino)-4(3H)-pyrimidinone 5'-phosphate reductase